MFIHELKTAKPNVRLIAPEVERDAPLSVSWLADPHGRETLWLMGVVDAENRASTLSAEKARIQDFLDNGDTRNWMIELDGRVVGAIWVDLKPTQYIPEPSIHLMLGDRQARGQGVGSAAFSAVLEWARSQGLTIVTRALLTNATSCRMLEKLGGQADGRPYRDDAALEWQNYWF